MKRFEDYSSLQAEINADSATRAGQANRYAVRLILLSDFRYFHKLIETLNAKVIELSQLLEYDNNWIGMNRLVEIVQRQKADSIVIPVSEVIRFYSDADFNGFLSSILLMQNPGNIRIYIPLISVENRFQQFWSIFNRRNEGPPVWNLKNSSSELQTIHVYSCGDNVDARLSTINTNREWLEYWKSDRETPLVTKSKSLITRWDKFLPSGCFKKDSINTAKDVLEKILELNFHKQYKIEDEQNWKALLSDCEKLVERGSSFPVKIIERLLGINDFSQIDDMKLLYIYLKEDDYSRWLISLLLEQLDSADTYLTKVIVKLDDRSEFALIRSLYFEVFHLSGKFDLEHRKKLIESLPADYETLVKRFIESWFAKLKESEYGIELCTTYSLEEKEYILLDVASSQNYAVLWTSYPELAAYLDWDKVSNQNESISEQFIDYFKHYNQCKLENVENPEYTSRFDALNADKDSFYKWYYATEELKIKDGYNVVQFDGVGAEWLPYILYCIEFYMDRYSKVVESYDIKRAELPTITQLNKIRTAEFVADFDRDVIHESSGYHYPLSLIKSLDLIKELIRVHVMLSPHDKICLCADHGASFMCSKSFGAINMHKDLTPRHEGRYYDGAKKMPDNPVFFNVDKYFVALKHHVISSNVRREVHGGATPEEVLVPCIYITKSELAVSHEHSVSLSAHTLSFDSRILCVSVSPMPNSIPEFWIDDQRLEAQHNGKDYLLELSSLNPGKYQIRIVIQNITKIEHIEIGSGFVEEDLFDE